MMKLKATVVFLLSVSVLSPQSWAMQSQDSAFATPDEMDSMVTQLEQNPDYQKSSRFLRFFREARSAIRSGRNWMAQNPEETKTFYTLAGRLKSKLLHDSAFRKQFLQGVRDCQSVGKLERTQCALENRAYITEFATKELGINESLKRALSAKSSAPKHVVTCSGAGTDGIQLHGVLFGAIECDDGELDAPVVFGPGADVVLGFNYLALICTGDAYNNEATFGPYFKLDAVAGGVGFGTTVGAAGVCAVVQVSVGGVGAIAGFILTDSDIF